MTPEEILKKHWDKNYTSPQYDKSHLKYNYEGLVIKSMTEYSSIVSAEKDKEIAELKRKIEADFISIDSLLSEFKRQGFNVSNWDGDEGAEKAIVDGVSVELAAAKERIAELEKEVERLKDDIDDMGYQMKEMGERD